MMSSASPVHRRWDRRLRHGAARDGQYHPGAEGANDRLTVIGEATGNDTINAGTLPAGIIGLTITRRRHGQRHHHRQSRGADTLIGGDGDDSVIGGRGDDVALLGIGNDTFTWNPGDGKATLSKCQDGLRHAAVQRLQRRRERFDIPRPMAAEVRLFQRRRQCHDGPERRRAHPARHPKRR